MRTGPPVSVAMCTYNGEAYLREQLESIARQTVPPDELVICDDRSSDSTLEIARAFAREAPFEVRIYANDDNLGFARNFERAIGLCRGELIFLADQDDVWAATKVGRIAAALAAAPGASVAFSDALLVGPRLEPLGRTLWSSIGFDRGKRSRIAAGQAFDVLARGNVVTGATMAFRAELARVALPVPEGWFHDAWLAVIASWVSKLLLVEEPLILYRQHAEQHTGAYVPSRLSRFATLLRTAQAYREKSRGHFQTDLRRSRQLRDRLAGAPGGRRDDNALRRLEAKIEHLQARLALPSRRRDRLPGVARELANLRYFRHSEGAVSALRDLLL